MVAAAIRNAPLVLIVEDNEDCRDLLGLYLELAGYRVVLAANVQGGLDALAAGGVSAVVTDFMLGGELETGPVLLDRARASGLLRDVASAILYTAFPKIAAASATPLARHPAWSERLHVIEKPHVDELREVLDRALRGEVSQSSEIASRDGHFSSAATRGAAT